MTAAASPEPTPSHAPVAAPSRTPAGDRASRVVEAIVLLAILVLAVGLRLVPTKGGAQFDELWHLGLSAGRGNPLGYFPKDVVVSEPALQTSTVGAPAFWHVWSGMDGVLHPPLYCTTLRLWRDVFGDAEATARQYSVLWAVVAIGFQYATMRLGLGRTLAALGALAIALAPTQEDLGQQIRGYQMLVGLGSIALWLMTRIELLGPTRRRAIALAAMTLPMLLTHYFAFGAALCIAGYGLWRLRGHRRAFLVSLVVAGAVYCTIWVPFAVQQINDLASGDDWLMAEKGDTLDMVLRLAAAPFRILVDRQRANEPLSVAMGLLYVMPWLLARRVPALRPWALWLTVSLLSIFGLDLIRGTRTVTITRYLDVAAPAIVPLIVGIAFAVRPRLGVACAATLVVFCGVYNASLPRELEGRMGYEFAVRAVAKRAKPGDALITYSGGDVAWLSQVLLIHAAHEPGLFPRPIVDMSGPLKPEVVGQLPRTTWLLSGALDRPIDQLVPGARVVGGQGVDRGVTLFQLEIAGATAATSPASTGPAAP